ncbi:MAG: alkaline phosphatase family protein [Hyphomicrobiales bacterium]|nr:alkaline phosphatase family protein [Hyphomicrobiales bacterium]MCP5372842.1 alkaline phosphatase family protein [Hyphomicrobiales bacterium]
MADVKNILFIMADQLRADYLSCEGHPHLHTPHLDGLAARGVRFTRAYVQAPVCGPSRMSFYTGRYVICHGASYNNYPLRVDERTMGDFLKPLGLRTTLVGKTHMVADTASMQRLGIDPTSSLGVFIRECGFEPYERDDGLHPDQAVDPNLAYNAYLRARGYAGDNPWHEYANAAAGPDGEVLSGWYMRNARLPARVAEEHSETAYMTDRAMAFIDEAGEDPWCLHLSYIKPHWPYMAPAPYHDMYGPQEVIAANRTDDERATPHPVIAAFMEHGESQCFARDEVRHTVIPTYMGLTRQIDDHMGRLFAFLEARGRLDDTLIVFTSDHGDYLGDHWLGEKDLFHEESVRIPLIVYDPSDAGRARAGTVVDDLVESIDLVPTFVEAVGGQVQPHLMEGRSLLPLLRGDVPADWRPAVFSESDFSSRAARTALGLSPNEARAFMVRTADWKLVRYERYPPQLFNLRDDPREQVDLGADPARAGRRAELSDMLFEWLRLRRHRVGISDAQIEQRTGTAHKRGYLFGVW